MQSEAQQFIFVHQKNTIIYMLTIVFLVFVGILPDINFVLLSLQEDTTRYAGLLLAPVEGFGLGRGFFYPLGKISNPCNI